MRRLHYKKEEWITKEYRKPTTTNAILHHSSFHPPHVEKSLPYGQFRRLRRINSEYHTFLEKSLELSGRLRARGYDGTTISRDFFLG